jgi:hypothetical protein
MNRTLSLTAALGLSLVVATACAQSHSAAPAKAAAAPAAKRAPVLAGNGAVGGTGDAAVRAALL